MAAPVRTCVGCRQRRESNALVRLTLDRSGTSPAIVVGGSSAGRGAWLCAASGSTTQSVDDECRRAALARGGFARAWRTVLGDDVAVLVKQLPAGRDPANHSPGGGVDTSR